MSLGQRLLGFLKTPRPRWVWVTLALGLPWLFQLSGMIRPGGCMETVSAICFWAALLLLVSLGIRGTWRDRTQRILLPVSRLLKPLQPRWAWMLLALGLPWLFLSAGDSWAGGCLLFVSALCFWTATAVLGALGIRQAWRRLLYRVSRRLWVILILVSILPAVALTVFLLSMGWMVLGGQASRSFQAELKSAETAVRAACEEPRDGTVAFTLRTLGHARVHRVTTLPRGLKPDFVGLTYGAHRDEDEPELAITAVHPTPEGFRIISLPLADALSRSQKLWGGRVHFELRANRQALDGLVRRKRLEAPDRVAAKELEHSWAVGPVQEGSFLFAPFHLPPTNLKVVEPTRGLPLVIKATPQTTLPELFAGYGFGNNEDLLTGETAGRLLGVGFLLLLLGCFQATALLVGLFLAHRLGGAINDLSNGVAHLTRGDYRFRLRLRGRDQIAGLTTSFNVLSERLLQAEEEREERLRLEEELKVAREVQMRLLPDLSRLTPSIQAVILPAREVAGDYFDVLKLAEHRFAFLIADVSGKGTSAAFYAAETKGVLSALDKHQSPAEVMACLNDIWCANNPRTLFMTTIYGTLDTQSGAFELVRAGHPAAWIRRASGEVERLHPRGLGIGLSAKAFRQNIEVVTGRLLPGDHLVACTDGLTEAMDPEGELFGEERLAAALAEAKGEVQVHLLRAVEAFTQGRALEDDLTLLVLRAPGESAMEA